MGYLHIDNLYKNQDVLLFRECYVLEKIHGTSAHVAWKDGKLRFFSGGEDHLKFTGLFNQHTLSMLFKDIETENTVVYGEAYGGKQQGMKDVYGDRLKFVVFDVKIGDCWLTVPRAEKVAKDLGLEFVWYEKCSTNIGILDLARDLPSNQAHRNFMGYGKKSEGIVIRPLIELTKNNGSRVIAKHKNMEFQEYRTQRKIKPEQDLELLEKVKDICLEWVTENRLSNILSHMQEPIGIEATGNIIRYMQEDIQREAKDEILESKLLWKAVARETALMFKRRIAKVNPLNKP